MMTLVKAGFELLYFFASCDGDVQEQELQVIKKYLEKNFKYDFDPVQQIKNLCSLENGAAAQRLNKVANYIKDRSDLQSMENLLVFAYRLIASDGGISEKEQDMFSIVGSIWKIDLKALLKKHNL